MTHMPLHIASTGMRWLDHIHATKNTVKLSDRTDHSPLQDIVRITTVSCENGGGEFILCSTYPPPRAVPCSPMDNGYDEHSNYVGLFFAYNFSCNDFLLWSLLSDPIVESKSGFIDEIKPLYFSILSYLSEPN